MLLVIHRGITTFQVVADVTCENHMLGIIRKKTFLKITCWFAANESNDIHQRQN